MNGGHVLHDPKDSKLTEVWYTGLPHLVYGLLRPTTICNIGALLIGRGFWVPL